MASGWCMGGVVRGKYGDERELGCDGRWRRWLVGRIRVHRDLKFHFHGVVVYLAEDRVFVAQYGTEGIDLFQCAFKIVFGSGYRSHREGAVVSIGMVFTLFVHFDSDTQVPRFLAHGHEYTVIIHGKSTEAVSYLVCISHPSSTTEARGRCPAKRSRTASGAERSTNLKFHPGTS